MPAVYIPKQLEMVVKATQEGQERIMVINHKHSLVGVPTVAQLLALATDYWTRVLAPYYKPIVTSNVNFDSITVTDKSIAGGNQAVYVPPQPQPGGATGDSLPGNATASMSWRSSQTGRAHRGRNYFFGLGDTSANGSTLTNASGTAISTLMGNMLVYNGIAGMPTSFVIASKVLVQLTPVLGYVLDAFVDSMRRRLLQRGA